MVVYVCVVCDCVYVAMCLGMAVCEYGCVCMCAYGHVFGHGCVRVFGVYICAKAWLCSCVHVDMAVCDMCLCCMCVCERGCLCVSACGYSLTIY